MILLKHPANQYLKKLYLVVTPNRQLFVWIYQPLFCFNAFKTSSEVSIETISTACVITSEELSLYLLIFFLDHCLSIIIPKGFEVVLILTVRNCNYPMT